MSAARWKDAVAKLAAESERMAELGALAEGEYRPTFVEGTEWDDLNGKEAA